MATERSNESRQTAPLPSILDYDILGDPKPFDRQNLPTFGEILLHYNSLIESNDEPHLHDVLIEVSDIWRQRGIPHFNANLVVAAYRSYVAEYRWLQRNHHHLQDAQLKPMYLTKLRDFWIHSSQLFDVSVCKCDLTDGCNCIGGNKIPMGERAFLQKQREGRIFTASFSNAIKYVYYCCDDDAVHSNCECRIRLFSAQNAILTDQMVVRMGENYEMEIFRGMVASLEMHNRTLLSIEAICCDGTALHVIDSDRHANALHVTGVIPLFEIYVNRPLQYLVSMLHINDELLKCLCQELKVISCSSDGIRSLGSLGRQLAFSNRLTVGKFRFITTLNLPLNIDSSNLNAEETYLFDLMNAISSGNVSCALTRQVPGAINSLKCARVLASRILRLYMVEQKPSKKLTTLTIYIMHVYIPMLLHIRQKNFWQYGSAQTFFLIKFATKLTGDFVFPNFEQHLRKHAFYLHPENLILTMITDERIAVRNSGLRKILQIRQTVRQNTVRVFYMPEINMAANDYMELIDWNRELVTEPPLTMNISNAIIQSYYDSDVIIELPKYACEC